MSLRRWWYAPLLCAVIAGQGLCQRDEMCFAWLSDTGAMLWEHRPGVACINTVCTLDHRQVIISDFDGFIRLLRHDE